MDGSVPILSHRDKLAHYQPPGIFPMLQKMAAGPAVSCHPLVQENLLFMSRIQPGVICFSHAVHRHVSHEKKLIRFWKKPSEEYFAFKKEQAMPILPEKGRLTEIHRQDIKTLLWGKGFDGGIPSSAILVLTVFPP